MKRVFNLAQFLGCCVISVGIIIAGWLISMEMPDKTVVPSNLYVTSRTEDSKTESNYLSKYEAAGYLRIDAEKVQALLDAGELAGTYVILEDSYVFSREKLDEWIQNRFE